MLTPDNPATQPLEKALPPPPSDQRYRASQDPGMQVVSSPYSASPSTMGTMTPAEKQSVFIDEGMSVAHGNGDLYPPHYHDRSFAFSGQYNQYNPQGVRSAQSEGKKRSGCGSFFVLNRKRIWILLAAVLIIAMIAALSVMGSILARRNNDHPSSSAVAASAGPPQATMMSSSTSAATTTTTSSASQTSSSAATSTSNPASFNCPASNGTTYLGFTRVCNLQWALFTDELSPQGLRTGDLNDCISLCANWKGPGNCYGAILHPLEIDQKPSCYLKSSNPSDSDPLKPGANIQAAFVPQGGN